MNYLSDENIEYIYRKHKQKVYEADTGLYAEGTAEKLAENYVKMLESLQ